MYNYSFIVTDYYIAFELYLNNIDIILYKILDDDINLLFNIKQHYIIIALDKNLGWI